MTELGRHLTPETIKEMTDRLAARGPVSFKDVPHGAATQVWAAVSPELEGVGGRYLEDVRIANPSRGENDPSGYAAHAVDPEIAARLWTLSEKLVGQRFDVLSSASASRARAAGARAAASSRPVLRTQASTRFTTSSTSPGRASARAPGRGARGSRCRRSRRPRSADRRGIRSGRTGTRAGGRSARARSRSPSIATAFTPDRHARVAREPQQQHDHVGQEQQQVAHARAARPARASPRARAGGRRRSSRARADRSRAARPARCVLTRPSARAAAARPRARSSSARPLLQ